MMRQCKFIDLTNVSLWCGYWDSEEGCLRVRVRGYARNLVLAPKFALTLKLPQKLKSILTHTHTHSSGIKSGRTTRPQGSALLWTTDLEEGTCTDPTLLHPTQA